MREEARVSRDPDRIEPILAELAAYWKANPDMRLGQIVVNASDFGGGRAPFFTEDDQMLSGLRRLAKEAWDPVLHGRQA